MIFLGILFMLPPSAAFAADLHVPGSYTTIQEAVDAAAEGDTVIVSDGTYQENITVDKPMTIRSENGAEYTFIQALDTGFHGFYVIADQVSIEGFTVTGVDVAGAAGICVASGYSRCIIRGNHVGTESSGNVYGIYLSESDDNHLEGNVVSNNTDYGVVVLRGTNNTLADNQLTANGRYGIYGWEASGNQFIGNEFLQGVSYGMVLSNDCDDNLISGNVFTDNYGGIRISYSSGNRIVGNFCENGTAHAILVDHDSTNNRISGNECINTSMGAGIQLWETGENDIFENQMSGNTNGIAFQTVTAARVYANSCISNTQSGILLGFSSQENQVHENECTGNAEDGVGVYESSLNSIRSNDCSNNGRAGLYLLTAQDNVFFQNNATGNVYGIWTQNSPGNRLFLNSFAGSTASVFSLGSEILWQTETQVSYIYQGAAYNGFLGNFYSDHDLTDSDGDGVTDLAKDQPDIDADDNYPLAVAHEYFIVPSSDMDNDGDVDGMDITVFSTALYSADPAADLNVDLLLDVMDIETFAAGFGK